MCYHVGPRNHSGTFTTQSPSPSPIGSNTSRIKEDWGSKAKPVKYGIALDVGEARQTLGKNWPNYHGAFWELMK